MDHQSNPIQKRTTFVFYIIATLIIVMSIALVFVFVKYKPVKQAPQEVISLEAKIAYLQGDLPLPSQANRPEIPTWMVGMIVSFIILQMFPVLFVAHKIRAPEFSYSDLKQIEFLVEMPMYLGLLGSLLGVCLTHFISGTLSAPLAYFTTIAGILLYLMGRFTILATLPAVHNIEFGE